MILNAGTDQEVTVRLFLASEELGQEFFDPDDHKELDKELHRLITSAIRTSQEDGITRQVGVMVVPKNCCEHNGNEEEVEHFQW